MSKIFGEIRQLAFIVDDIDDAMAYWAKVLGIGPFFIKREISFSPYVYHENLCQSPTVSIALANSGYIQIELIQQHDLMPSIYLQDNQSGKSTMHHVSSWLTSAELRLKKTELLNKGYQIAQECTIQPSGVQLIYFKTEDFFYEISDLGESHHSARITGIRQAYEFWDAENLSQTEHYVFDEHNSRF